MKLDVEEFLLFFKRWSFSLLILVFGAPSAFGITPMDYYNSLVAGRDETGFRDGAFSQALFNHPCALAMDDSGNRLFVADRDNNRIRVIYLNDNNRVETLAGTNTPGKTDGQISKALFNQPTALAFLPDNRLVIYDGGNNLLRLIDLKNMIVSTLAGDSAKTSLGNVWNLCYLPQDDSLYFSEPSEGKLVKWNMKSKKLETVLSNNAQVPMPRAICVSANKLYVTDLNLPEVYQIEPSGNTALAVAKLTKVGTCEHVHALAGSNEAVYAEQEGSNALFRILPDNQPVSLATAWGDMVENNDPVTGPLLSFSRESPPSGFVVSPIETRRLFITCPELTQSIMSVKDYDFGKWWNSFSNNDFDYPDAKPAGTFRILVVGDSRVGSAMPLTPLDELNDPNFDIHKWDGDSKRVNTFSKQLEFLLNAKASVNGVRNHFEVLALSVPGTSSGSLVNGPALDIARRKDVDLMIALAGPSTYQDFFGEPLTAEGLPGSFDPEYAFKPVEARISPGVPRHLFDLCKQKNLVRTEKDRLLWFIDWSNWDALDPEIKKDLMDLTARPFQVCQNKVQSMKTSGPMARKLLVLYIPWKNWSDNSYEQFWIDTCSAEHLNFLDLSDPFYAMKTSFYPTDEKGLTSHYLLHGNTLIAFLMSELLIRQKWVPFDPEK